MAMLPRFRQRKPPERNAGYWLRIAYQRMRNSSATDASRAALAWAQWAAAEVDADRLEHTGEAAEAYQEVIRQFIRELSRRTGPAQIRHHAARMQGVAAEAGYWLVRAGRGREAVAAVELARAVLLSSRMQRLPRDLERRLCEMRRADLFERYRAAERTLDELERRGYDPPTDEGEPGESAVLTPEREAWSRFHVLRREVADVLAAAGSADPGFTDSVDEIEWSSDDGRLVYLAASQRGGYALLLDGTGAPREIQLPALTRDVVDAAVVELGQLLAHQSQDAAVWADLLGRLGSQVMGPVLDVLPPGGDLVLVPLGGLGVLPLHAAILSGGSEGGQARRRHACDLVDIRYAPNARLAVDAIRTAAPGPPATVLVAGVNQPASSEDVQELLFAEKEADLVCARMPGRWRRPRPATLSAVLAELDGADVWHFACHGIANTADPLDSAILLTDQPLRLRHLMSRHTGRHRLAVLSACETNVPDPQRIDEAIGFPGALMRAGVSGVIATQWSVDDATAVLLMQRFYELWLDGLPPHRALGQAQRWLRTATLAEITSLMPPRRATTRLSVAHRSRSWPPEGLWAEQPYADKPWTWAAFAYTGA